MPEQQLHGPQVLGVSIHQRSLRASVNKAAIPDANCDQNSGIAEAAELFESLVAGPVLVKLTPRFPFHHLRYVAPPMCNLVYVFRAKHICQLIEEWQSLSDGIRAGSTPTHGFDERDERCCHFDGPRGMMQQAKHLFRPARTVFAASGFERRNKRSNARPSFRATFSAPLNQHLDRDVGQRTRMAAARK